MSDASSASFVKVEYINRAMLSFLGRLFALLVGNVFCVFALAGIWNVIIRGHVPTHHAHIVGWFEMLFIAISITIGQGVVC